MIKIQKSLFRHQALYTFLIFVVIINTFKKMSVLLEFAMFPTDKGESISPYVSKVIKMIHESGATYQLTAMGTIIETETMSEALALVQQSYDVLEPDCDRVYSSLKFDIRKGKSKCLTQKIKSVEKIIGEVNK